MDGEHRKPTPGPAGPTTALHSNTASPQPRWLWTWCLLAGAGGARGGGALSLEHPCAPACRLTDAYGSIKIMLRATHSQMPVPTPASLLPNPLSLLDPAAPWWGHTPVFVHLRTSLFIPAPQTRTFLYLGASTPLCPRAFGAVGKTSLQNAGPASDALGLMQ